MRPTVRTRLEEYKRYCHMKRPFPFYVGSMFIMRRFQLVRHCVPSTDNLSLRHVAPGVIQPLVLRTSCPSLPRHLYHHHSLAHTFFFSSQYMTIPLQTTFMHFLDTSPTFAIPAILSFLILSSLILHSSILTPSFPPLIVISSLPMYIRFCPGSCSFIHILYYHYIIIWQSLLPLAPPIFLTRHSIVRLPCVSTRCCTADIASAIPLPGIKPNFASLSLLSIILSQLCKVYQCYPSAIPTTLGVSLVFINWAAGVQSDYLSTPLILSCSYRPTLCFRLITCQSLLHANTSSGIPSISVVSPFFIRDNVTLQYLILADLLC